MSWLPGGKILETFQLQNLPNLPKASIETLAKLDRFRFLILDDTTHPLKDQAETLALFELIA